MTSRLPCDVPGCGNSSRKWAELGCASYICGPHWRMVPKRLKRRRRLICRLAIRRSEMRDHGDHLTAVSLRAARLEGRAWAAIVRGAIQAAAGI